MKVKVIQTDIKMQSFVVPYHHTREREREREREIQTDIKM